MPHILEITLTAKLNGQTYPGFPLIRRLQVDQIDPLGYIQDALAGYTSLAGNLTTLQVAILTVDQALSIRLNNQNNQHIPLNGNGLICLFDVNIDTPTLLSVLGGAVNSTMNGILGGSN